MPLSSAKNVSSQNTAGKEHGNHDDHDHQHRKNVDLEEDEIPDSMPNKVLTIFRTPNQQEEDQKMKGKNAEQIFKNLQQKYVDNCLSKNVEGAIIKVHLPIISTKRSRIFVITVVFPVPGGPCINK